MMSSRIGFVYGRGWVGCLCVGVRLLEKGLRPDEEKAAERRGEKRSDIGVGWIWVGWMS